MIFSLSVCVCVLISVYMGEKSCTIALPVKHSFLLKDPKSVLFQSLDIALPWLNAFTDFQILGHQSCVLQIRQF